MSCFEIFNTKYSRRIRIHKLIAPKTIMAIHWLYTLPCQPHSRMTTNQIVMIIFKEESAILYLPKLQGRSSHRHNIIFKLVMEANQTVTKQRI